MPTCSHRNIPHEAQTHMCSLPRRHNVGFKCTLYGYPARKAGVVVLTNGDDGNLPEDIAKAVIRTYGG